MAAETKSKHHGCARGFHWLSEAWYGEANLKGGDMIDQVMLGFYAPEGGTSGEFAIRWTMVGREITPRLEVFNDAWDALHQCADVLAKLAEIDNQHATPAEICALLKDCGFVDLTDRNNPYTASQESAA